MALLMATATGYSQQSIHEAAAQGNLAAVERYLQQGVAVDARDDKNQTPLMWAASMGYLDVVVFLISNGADVNAKNNSDKTPLILAVYYGKQDIVNCLVAKGADPKTRSQDQVDGDPMIQKIREDMSGVRIEKNADGSAKIVETLPIVRGADGKIDIKASEKADRMNQRTRLPAHYQKEFEREKAKNAGSSSDKWINDFSGEHGVPVSGGSKAAWFDSDESDGYAAP